MKRIFLIAGKACAGKDTLVKELVEELKLPIALSFTTRPKRAGETQGVEYDFINEEDFGLLWGYDRLAEFTSYTVVDEGTCYYGLTREELEKDEFVVAIANPDGVKQIEEIYGDKVTTVLITADDKSRIKRYLDRDNTNNVAECCRRFMADEVDFEDFECDYVIVNDDFKVALDKLKTFVKNSMAKTILNETNEEFKRNPMKFIGDRDA